MLVPIDLPPGIDRNATAYDTRNRWYDMNLVRWTSGTMRPVGGWQKVTATALTGTIRKLHLWRANNGTLIRLIGTDTKLYSCDGPYTDITPASFVTLSSRGLTGQYSGGNYGAGAYGTSTTTDATFVKYAYWTFDNWGEDAIACASTDGRLLYFTKSTPTTAPVAISGAPTGNNAVVVTDERHVMAIGTTDSGTYYPRRVAWSSREDRTDWNYASTTNTAGYQDLTIGGELLKGVKVKEGILIFGHTDVVLAQYVGQPFIYGFTTIAQTEMMHPDSIATFNGKAVWLSRKGFQLYDGGSVVPLECPILKEVLAAFDSTYGSYRVHASHHGLFPEIWFFYCTTGTEANKYVVWNYLENWWGWGTMARSAMFPAGAYQYPILGNSAGNLYEHENGWTDAGAARFSSVFIESSALGIGAGDKTIEVRQALVGSNASNALTVSLYGKFTPDGSERTFGPYTPRANGYTDTRANGREVRMRLAPSSDADWGVGQIRLDVCISGDRPMRVNLPASFTGWTQLMGALNQAFISVVSQDQASNRVILASPNGTTYAVTVSNAGALVVTAITGKTREV